MTIKSNEFVEKALLLSNTIEYAKDSIVSKTIIEKMINKKSHTVSSGQMIIMPANIPHAVNARKRFKMLLIMIKG
jgi:hypothetical protein